MVDRTDGTDESIRRRDFLSAGIGLPALASGIPTTGLGRRTRVVTDRAGKHQDAVRTEKVPKKWLRHEEAIRRTNRALGRSILEDDAVVGVGVGASTKRTDGLAYARQEIYVDSTTPARARERLPSTLSEAGVKYGTSAVVDESVDVVESPNRELMSANFCAGTVSPDPYPGGAAIRDPDSNTFESGTSGYWMKKDDGSGHVITAANHVFNSGCYTLASGKADSYDWDEIGTIIDGHKTRDWIVIEPSSVDISSIDSSIYRGPGNTSHPIGGYKTDNGLAALKDQSYAVEKMGASTGLEGGTLEAYNGQAQDLANCISTDGQGVKVNVKGAKGDSGGPMYAIEMDYDYGDGKGGEYASVISGANMYSGSSSGTACNGNTIKDTIWGYATKAIINNNPYYIPKW